MHYFNGFSLHNEEGLFSEYLVQSDFCVAGFSYGAQKAFEYAYESNKRIDRVILLSPAFFQVQKSSFTRTQLRYFKSGKEAYISQFLKNAAYPSCLELTPFLYPGKEEELEALLTYKWDKRKIEALQKRGTTIEVFLGAKDRIIDAQKAFDFFSEIAVCYYMKNAGHLLQEK